MVGGLGWTINMTETVICNNTFSDIHRIFKDELISLLTCLSEQCYFAKYSPASHTHKHTYIHGLRYSVYEWTCMHARARVPKPVMINLEVQLRTELWNPLL